MANSEKALLVEGITDKHVVFNICAESSPQIPEFSVFDQGNIDRLLDSVYIEVTNRERTVLGIMLDANDHPEGRWQAVGDRLRKAGIALPSFPQPEGVVIDSEPSTGLPRVGVWMMPNNESPGELENFLAEMIPTDDTVYPLAQAYINGIPPGHREFQEGKTLRAQVHAWLAAREDPRQPGLAIKARDLAIDGPLCVRFTAWLRRLFGEPHS